MDNDSPLLFALARSHEFGQRVANYLGVPLAAHEEREFEDREYKVRTLQNVRGRECFVLHSLYGEPAHSGDDKLNRLLFLIAALKDASAARVTAVVPYLAYARKDRKTKPRDPVTLRYVAQLFEAVGTDALLALEVHNPAAFQNAFRCPTEQLHSAGLFVEHLASRLGSVEVAVVSPDAGGVKRAALLRQWLEHALGRPVTFGFVEKFRSAGVLSGDLMAGDVAGRHVLLFDDLIASGQTLLRAANTCRVHGAVSVWSVAAHGLFMGDAPQILGSGLIERVFVTDSVVAPQIAGSPLEARLNVVSCAPLFAEAIRRSYAGGSISDLMQS